MNVVLAAERATFTFLPIRTGAAKKVEFAIVLREPASPADVSCDGLLVEVDIGPAVPFRALEYELDEVWARRIRVEARARLRPSETIKTMEGLFGPVSAMA